jgi:hypothetical protein
MGILIGMDEAGYGPHLGPLAIAATAWQVPDDPSADGPAASAAVRKRRDRRPSANGSVGSTSATAVATPKMAGRQLTADGPDLYRLLRGIVCKKSSDRRLAIADSKVLYSPGAGLRQLERGLHTVLRAMRQNVSCWSSMVHYANADPDGHHARNCWPDGHNSALPIDATEDEVERLDARFSRTCATANVKPLLIRARLVFPQQFNELVEHYGNKGAALSHLTVGLLREVVDAVSESVESKHPMPIFAVGDKHGGRNFYTALLQHHFSEYWVNPVFESHAESHYEWGEPDCRTRVVFQVNGERFFPTALASMTAKYLRELSMRAFNEFWRAHIPDIRSTAGYYRDAWRFRNEIAAKQRELKIDDHVIWRSR